MKHEERIMYKILFVEDDVDFLTVMQKRLIEQGYQVLSVSDCFSATQLAHSEKLDVIVLDLKIPGGGANTLKNLKMSVHTSGIPVIISTASDDPEEKKIVLAQNPSAYLEKPYDSKLLIKTIEEIMSSRHE